MAKNQTYKLVVNNKLNLHLPTHKIKKLLIVGNTVNLFGFVDAEDRIDCFKMTDADYERYFWLISKIKEGVKIMIIGDKEVKRYYEDLFSVICKLHPNTGNRLIPKYTFKKALNNNDYINIINKLVIGMPHFDVTIMNPPYNKNTHLKILDTIRNYSSKIINISPVRWLTDPFASLKKSTLRSYETLAKHINSINIIESRDASALFGIQIYSDVAIYEMSENENPNFDYFNFWKITKTPVQISIIDKIINNKKTKLKDVIEHSMNDGIRVPVTDIAGNRGCLPTYKDICYCVDGYVDGKLWHACKNNGGYEKEGEMIPNSIKFENIPDAVNFYNSYQNLLELKGICRLTVQQQHIQTFVLPFLDDYSHPITKEDIKKYYNFTDDEINELGRIGQLKNNEKYNV